MEDYLKFYMNKTITSLGPVQIVLHNNYAYLAYPY